MQFSVRYTLLFSAAVCIACAVIVSSAAVGLKGRQDVNKALDKKKNVLQAAALVETGASITPEEIDKLFGAVRTKLIDIKTGDEVDDPDPAGFDQQKAKRNPATSMVAPANRCTIKRIPQQVQIFEVLDDAGEVEMLVLPIEGYGLWSTLLGFVALDKDLTTVRGLTYYDHKETPGLGGEVDNPSWKALWPGRKIFDSNGMAAIEVIKGRAKPATEEPFEVDGLSGATITSRGVTCMLRFWLGPEVYGPMLDRYRKAMGATRRAA